MRTRQVTTQSLLCCMLWLALALGPSTTVHAEPLPLVGTWVEPPAVMAAQSWERPLDLALPEQAPRRTGGRYWYEAELVVPKSGVYVIDFAQSTTIGRFRHLVFDARGALIADRHGGIQSAMPNLFMLRHGRALQLQRGVYHLRTELRSPFFLSEPQPYVEDLHAYTATIKAGTTVTLLSLGVLLGLGFCYAVLARARRRRRTDTLYALVIVGNVLYNGTALLVLPDLFGMHWIHLLSVSLLLSNVTYVLFVTSLLELTPATHPRLYRAAMLLLAAFVLMLAVAARWPHTSLELGRLGVSLLTPCAFVAALVRAREGNASARLYLVALGATYALGGVTMSMADKLSGLGLYIEHLGLLASATEALLLALVLAHQFSVLHAQREHAEHRAREGQRIAHSDPLTGLPNRSALDTSLATLPPNGSLTFIDLDGLKHYNDKYGHQRGDELLCSFAQELDGRLGEDASLFRLGGDEFAITCPDGDAELVNERIGETVEALRSERFKMTGASAGTVHVHERATTSDLKHLADTRMYEEKRRRRSSANSDWLRDDPPRNTSRPPPPQSGAAPKLEIPPAPRAVRRG